MNIYFLAVDDNFFYVLALVHFPPFEQDFCSAEWLFASVFRNNG